jgi:hypothetical protein
MVLGLRAFADPASPNSLALLAGQRRPKYNSVGFLHHRRGTFTAVADAPCDPIAAVSLTLLSVKTEHYCAATPSSCVY